MARKKKRFKGRIRPAWTYDLDLLVGLISELAASDGEVATVSRDELARDILGPWPWMRVLIAETDKKVVGYAALCPVAELQFGKRGLEVQHLFVVTKARRTGVATALIRAGQDLALDEGCTYLSVGAHPENEVARGIYLRMGFAPQADPWPRFHIALTRQG
ncbi:GNAT family N-acetyltransferase [uncultured Roseobacter sp.]|uniref:GNAT family N-acetyltransferase n=1 Tax=uncultured Roseobacter sp. TaxID=114847 RepID=UPI00260BAA32|nr:GNAT family N-acetyltransferase [uncultured Roseobacter sp.]